MSEIGSVSGFGRTKPLLKQREDRLIVYGIILDFFPPKTALLSDFCSKGTVVVH